MLTTPVALGAKSYEVVTGRGLLGECGARARAMFPGSGRCVVITDTNVGPLYAGRVVASLAGAGIEAEVITVPAGEPSKSFGVLETVTRGMIRAGLDRKAFAVALGGGVIGDLAGFAASVFFRGIPVVQIPTTIVSVVDSSVGGKTGINTAEGKNLIGTFHQPRLVLIDPETLGSLPDREYREGFAEVIKHAAIRDAAMLDELEVLAGEPGRGGLEALIARNVAIKAAIVSEDEFETKGLRALLNFGHTIGHGIEASAGYGEMLHGEAISLGMRAALGLSEEFAGLDAAVSRRLVRLLGMWRLPLVLPGSIGTGTVLEKMGRDKKFDHGRLKFVLLRAAGDAFVSGEVTAAAAERAIEGLREAPGE
jgi:3-dehydroquinate synthase